MNIYTIKGFIYGNNVTIRGIFARSLYEAVLHIQYSYPKILINAVFNASVYCEKS